MKGPKNGDKGRRSEQEEEPRKQTFISAPSAEDLSPTQQESYLLGELWDWRERSAKQAWVLGEPLGM